MDRMRFSMAALIATVGLLAVGLAALKSANDVWFGVIAAIVIGTLLFAILGCMHSSGASRRFWSGFALFGWTYLILIYAPWLNDIAGQYMPTERFFQWAYHKMSQVRAPAITSEHVSLWIQAGGQIWIDGNEASDDEQVVQLVGQTIGQKNRPEVYLYEDPTSDAQSRKNEVRRLTRLLRAANITVRGYSSVLLFPIKKPFLRLGHFLTAVPVGLLGGLMARFLLRNPEQIAKS